MENKLKAIIVDDENNGREVLRKLLKKFFPEIELLGEAENAASAFELINARDPNLVFLDIQMPRESGFDLLRKFGEISFEVIFVTSYDQYAINAIKFSALDYLLKPVEIKDLSEALAKAKKSIERKNRTGAQLINLLNSFELEKERKIAVHVGENVKLINSNEIIYVEADGRYSVITTLENEHFITAKYLKEFEEYFENNSDLVRIHKSCIINIRHITEYRKGEPCVIEMCNGKLFEVSRRKKVEILAEMKKR